MDYAWQELTLRGFILTSIRDKSFLHQLLNFRPPPASPKIAGAILGEVQAYALT